MSLVGRDSLAGRAYLDLRKLARRSGRPTEEFLHTYALEGFLVRMVSSPQSTCLVLKGGVLMAAFAQRRPTRDVDLAARALSGEVADVLALIRTIVAIPVDDGLVFDPSRAEAGAIRDADQYSGVRVALPCSLASARIRFHVDVNVGDPIWPEPSMVALPKMLGGILNITGYPMAMVYAEKIVTALERGVANTRWRDFADIYLLSRVHAQDRAELVTAIEVVASHRQVKIATLTTALVGFPQLAQPRWAAWRRKQLLDDRLPDEFAVVISAVIAFADPCLVDAHEAAAWDPDGERWVPTTD
jgi:hypothetical protein